MSSLMPQVSRYTTAANHLESSW